MVTKNQKKLIRSLKQKKNRKTYNYFVAEGVKVINEFIDASLQLKHLFVLQEHLELFKKANNSVTEVISKSDLSQ